MKKNLILFYCFFLLFTAISFSQDTTDKPEKNPILTDKYQFGAGIFFPSKDFQLKVDGATPNDEIEFGKALGSDSSELTFF